MIRLTDSAKEDLTAFFSNKPPSPIRVQLAPGGCMGPKLAVDLDEQRDTDQVQKIDGLTFVIDAELQARIGRVTIDVDYTGFCITSERQPNEPCSGGDCGSCAGGSGTICPF